MHIILIAIAIFLLIALFIQIFPFILVLLGLYLIYRLIRVLLKNRYFKSEAFLNHKEKIENTINEFNELATYASDIPNQITFNPKNFADEYSHLAKFENTSKHNYKREKNVRTKSTPNVHSTSLQVVRKASEEPIKYLCKYFNIKPTQETIDELQLIGDNLYRIEQATETLELRQQEIANSFTPPKYILKHYYHELSEKIGMSIPNIHLEYPQYIFEYLSAGGNSSQTTTITFNGETIEAVTQYTAEKVRYKKSAKAQRALMTTRLRQEIKDRDNFTCQNCGMSTYEQSLLLLEIDHIVPISKGGMSTKDNLQTLCWKCNRSKSNKIL